MSMLSVNIQHKQIVSTRMAVRARVYVKSVELFKRIVVGVEYCDSIGILFDGPTVVISGDDYAKWANDDTYIVNYVYEHIGISLFPEPAPVEEPSEPTLPPTPIPTQSEEPAVQEPDPAPTQSEEPSDPPI